MTNASRRQSSPTGGADSATGASGVNRLARACLSECDVLADRFVAAIQDIPAYRDGWVPKESMYGNARLSIELLLRLIARAPVSAELAGISAEVGRDRARRGVPIEALVQAVQVNFRIVWEALLDRAGPDDAAELLASGALVWEAVGMHLSRILDAYQETVRTLAQEHQDMRRASFSALVETKGHDRQVAADTAAALGLQESARFAVVVAAPGAEHKLRQVATDIASRAIGIYHQEAPTGDLLVVQLPERLHELPTEWLQGIPCGVGPVATGLENVPASLVVTTAMARLRLPGPLVLHDAWLDLISSYSGAILPLLVSEVLGPLAVAEDPESQRILETVDAYLGSTSSVTEAAARLYCHRNTIVNRLRRFTELTGRDVRRAEDAAVVVLALRAVGSVRRDGARG